MDKVKIQTGHETTGKPVARGYDTLSTPTGKVLLPTGDVTPIGPTDFMRNVTAGRYYPRDAARLLAVLRQRMLHVLDDEAFDQFLDLMGLTMSGRAQSYASIVLVLGSSGSGKSNLVKLLETAMGDCAYHADGSWLTRKGESDLDATGADLLDKQPRMVVVSEIGLSWREEIGRLLPFTGGDPITARRPYGNPQTGNVSFALWATAVDPPSVRVDSGIQRRLALLQTRGIDVTATSDHDSTPTYSADLLDAVVTLGCIRAREVFKPGYVPPRGRADEREKTARTAPEN